MANLKQRLHRKNSSGSYDTIYLETLASLVKMDDGTTLTGKLSSMDTAINGKAASNHTHSNATTSAAGFMTGDMVTKLNGIAAGANAYSHPSAKQCNYAYTHPSTKQCNYSVDTSGFATTAQLNEVKTSVSNGKSAIASAITDKGVSTAASADFSTMANNIRSIQVNKPHTLITDLSATNVSGDHNYFWIQSPQLKSGMNIERMSVLLFIYGVLNNATSNYVRLSAVSGSNTLTAWWGNMSMDGVIYTMYDGYMQIQFTSTYSNLIIITAELVTAIDNRKLHDHWIYI